MSTGESSAERQAALASVLEPGESLVWSAQPSGAPGSIWLPGCMAVPMLLIGLIALAVGIGSAAGGPDQFTGYQGAYTFGAVGAGLTLVALIVAWLPFRWRSRYRRMIYGLTERRLLQVVAGSGRPGVDSVSLDRIVSVDADPDSDGSGTLNIRFRVLRRVTNSNRHRPSIMKWPIKGVPDVAGAKRLFDERIGAPAG